MVNINLVAIPNVEFRYRNRSVPDNATDITAKTTYVTSIRVHNRTALAATFTMTDKDVTPFEYYTAINIAANSIANERIAAPIKFINGISISAGTADALTVEIFGWQDARV